MPARQRLATGSIAAAAFSWCRHQSPATLRGVCGTRLPQLPESTPSDSTVVWATEPRQTRKGDWEPGAVLPHWLLPVAAASSTAVWSGCGEYVVAAPDLAVVSHYERLGCIAA